MSITRRALLGGSVLALAGCAASPVVTGTPAAAPSPTMPTQSSEAASAAAAVAGLQALLGTLPEVAGWVDQPWAVAAEAQATAHLERMVHEDPLGPADHRGHLFEVEPAQVSAPADLAAAEAALAAAIDEADAALEAAATAVDDPELRLLYASARVSTVALRNRSVPPVPGEAEPHPMQDTTLSASLPIALGHTWALIYGLSVGLGRLDREEPLAAVGAARLVAAKEERNRLRDLLGADAPEQPSAFDLPTAMDSPEAIRAGWAELETNLLDSYGRLVAADADPDWRARFVGQVSATQNVGGTISFWQGWVA